MASGAGDLASEAMLQRLQVQVKINLRIDSDEGHEPSSDMSTMEKEACEVLLLLAQSRPKLLVKTEDEKLDVDADGYTSASESPDQGSVQWANGANAANAMKKKSRNKRSFDIDALRPFFNMPMATAAKKLEVCSSFLGKECRTHGISKWPYRQIRSLDQKIACARSSLSSCADNSMRDVIRARIQRYEQTRERLLEVGSAPDESDEERPATKQESIRVEMPSDLCRSTSSSTVTSPYGDGGKEPRSHPGEITHDNSGILLSGAVKRSRTATSAPTHAAVSKRVCVGGSDVQPAFDHAPNVSGSGAMSIRMIPSSIGMYQHPYQHPSQEYMYNSMPPYPHKLPPHMSSHPFDPSRGPGPHPYYPALPMDTLSVPMPPYVYASLDPRGMNERYMHHGMPPRFMYPQPAQSPSSPYGMLPLPSRM